MKPLEGRSETINETAEMVIARGGNSIAVRCDHTKESGVKNLAARIKREQKGQLDILVNDVWGGDSLGASGRSSRRTSGT
jgi:NAD(P)-dependent dehydrogenase (short-subunit alcohol dehydrogenase family)